ncbi:hypothetical protein BJF82_03265 [Kytococcus sp. CUA-901]|nr:hypothetical protein BJF82_03265 [Kytococcus sp. CUA-901]
MQMSSPHGATPTTEPVATSTPLPHKELPWDLGGKRLDVQVLRALAVGIVMSLGLAHLTYHHIEERFRAKGSQPLNWKALRVPAVSVVAGGATCAVLLFGALSSWGLSSLKTTSAKLVQRPARQDLCLNTTPVTDRDMSQCTWGADRPGKPIYLVGDSNAQMYTEGLIDASSELDRPLIVAATGGCPVVRVPHEVPGNPAGQAICERYAESAKSWLEQQPPGDVVMASSGEWFEMDTLHMLDDRGHTAVTPEEKEPIRSESLKGTITAFRAAGHEVNLGETSPHLKGKTLRWWNPVECSNWTLLRDPDGCGTETPLTAERARLAPVYRSEQAALAGTEATYVKVADELYADGRCAARRDGVWVYRDGLHISPQGSAMLNQVFERALKVED